MKVTYAIDLEQRDDAYFVSVWIEDEKCHEVGPMYDLAMAERVQDATAVGMRTVVKTSNGRILQDGPVRAVVRVAEEAADAQPTQP